MSVVWYVLGMYVYRPCRNKCWQKQQNTYTATLSRGLLNLKEAGSGVHGNLFGLNKVSVGEGRSCSGLSLGLRLREEERYLTVALVYCVACGPSGECWAELLAAEVLRVGLLKVESLAGERTCNHWRQSKAVLDLESRNTKTLILL